MRESSDQTFVPCLQDGYVGDGRTTKDTTEDDILHELSGGL